MARGKPIPGLEEAIKKCVQNYPGSTAVGIRIMCNEYLGDKLILSTINSALVRLLKEGKLRKQSPEGKKVPFTYFLEEEGEKDG